MGVHIFTTFSDSGRTLLALTAASNHEWGCACFKPPPPYLGVVTAAGGRVRFILHAANVAATVNTPGRRVM